MSTNPLMPGRIVHYVLPETNPRAGEIRPAIIVRVNTGLDHPGLGGLCNLKVVTDGPNDDFLPDLWVGSVPFSEQPEPGCWSWPRPVGLERPRS
ncbi:hypothetical protein Xaut_4495 [Xanthobacter versatilis]|uniref:Uncharacterized protein n=1 Tax=Xanthobacter autotrophicus (strain ATCC BAA-1158 / Py2) TaxID=78245 RepID=A7INX0_XANP2|nr:hypothetical protein Xaut_4495 [Xanthobacter autotrophicus Py2]